WMMYAQDYDETAPPYQTCGDTPENSADSCIDPRVYWFSRYISNGTVSQPGMLGPYVKSTQVFVCPSTTNVYGYNRRAFAIWPGNRYDGDLVTLGSIESPSTLIVSADAGKDVYRIYNDVGGNGVI